MNTQKPLAERMRPKTLDTYRGQSHLIGHTETGEPQVLQVLIDTDQIPSMILWGPPGTGKTTLARVIARATKAHFIQLSAVGAGVADVRKAVAEAESRARLGSKTILFIDEVHRFNKSQQDAFLPAVEDGTIIFIGATTENPSFNVNNALLSRARTFVLESLTQGDLEQIIHDALIDSSDGLGAYTIAVDEEAISYLAHMSTGDARIALGALEIAHQLTKSSADEAGSISITKEVIEKALQQSNTLYDRNGEMHYDIISAFHKSVRGGDADATVYWLTRMLAGGEDPLYIARRIIRIAAEDIGLANSFALPQATAAYDACRFIGMPECGVCLAQAAVYMAKSKKSVSVYNAYNESLLDARELGPLPVPVHLRNAPTKLMKDLGYGKNYKYTPTATAEENAAQKFMPDQIYDKKYLT